MMHLYSSFSPFLFTLGYFILLPSNFLRYSFILLFRKFSIGRYVCRGVRLSPPRPPRLHSRLGRSPCCHSRRPRYPLFLFLLQNFNSFLVFCIISHHRTQLYDLRVVLSSIFAVPVNPHPPFPSSSSPFHSLPLLSFIYKI